MGYLEPRGKGAMEVAGELDVPEFWGLPMRAAQGPPDFGEAADAGASRSIGHLGGVPKWL